MTKEKKILLVLAAIQFTHIVDFMIIMPLGPQLMRVFGISPQQFSFLVASYTFSAGISGFLAAFFIDRFDRKAALMFCYIGFTLGTLACAFAPTYEFLLISRILSGSFGGVLGSLILSIVGDLIPFERRGAAMGMVMASFSVASILGLPLGLYLATHFSWNATFWALFILAVIVLMLAWKVIPSIKGHIIESSIKGLGTIINILSNPNQQKALLLMFFLMIGQFSVLPFISPYLVFNVGFKETQLPLMYLIGGICSIITLPIIGKLSDTFGKYRIFSIFIVASIVPFFLLTNLGPSSVVTVLAISGLLFICMGGRSVPFMAMITSTVKPEQRGTFMSLNSSVQQITSGLASFLSGFIIQKSLSGELLNYQYVGYLAIFTSIITIFLARKLVTAH